MILPVCILLSLGVFGIEGRKYNGSNLGKFGGKIKSTKVVLGMETPFGRDGDIDDDAFFAQFQNSTANAHRNKLASEGAVIFSSESSQNRQSVGGTVIFSAAAQSKPPTQGQVIASVSSVNAGKSVDPLRSKVIFKSNQVQPVEKIIFESSPKQEPAEEYSDWDDVTPPSVPSPSPKLIANATQPEAPPVGTILSDPAPSIKLPKKIKYLDEYVLQALDFDPTYQGPRIDMKADINITFVKDTLIPFFKAGGLLDRKTAYTIFYRAFLEFNVEDTLEDVWLEDDEQLIVFGDIHGQFHDFLQVVDKEGFPTRKTKYLFNGDIVDRGAYSVECLLTLMALKIAEPDHVFVSLGNHETMTVGKLQFYKESVKKYGGDEFFKLAHQLFKSFPVSFLLEDEVFITHGGLSPFLRLERIRMIDRLMPTAEDSDIINDLTWSDPVDRIGVTASHRGLGYLYGPDITRDFVQFNNISVVIRSHQYKETGYSEQHDSLCITVFSCPNYRGSLKNLGAYLKINKNLDMQVINFIAASMVIGKEAAIMADAKVVRNLRRNKSLPFGPLN